MIWTWLYLMETKCYALYENFLVILFRFTLRLFGNCLGNKRCLSESLVHEKWKNAGHYNKDATDRVGNTSYIVLFYCRNFKLGQTLKTDMTTSPIRNAVGIISHLIFIHFGKVLLYEALFLWVSSDGTYAIQSFKEVTVDRWSLHWFHSSQLTSSLHKYSLKQLSHVSYQTI